MTTPHDLIIAGAGCHRPGRVVEEGTNHLPAQERHNDVAGAQPRHRHAPSSARGGCVHTAGRALRIVQP